MDAVIHYTTADLEAAAERLGASPLDGGCVALIVRRPGLGEREVLNAAELNVEAGLVGDNWLTRGSRHTPDGSAHPEMQIALMNSRVIEAIAGDAARWPLAGDQLFVDLDLSAENLPPGQRLAVGSAILEVTPMAHNGCAKFTERYGSDAIRWVNSPEGRALRRRGVYVRVVQAGRITVGDRIQKVP